MVEDMKAVARPSSTPSRQSACSSPSRTNAWSRSKTWPKGTPPSSTSAGTGS